MSRRLVTLACAALAALAVAAPAAQAHARLGGTSPERGAVLGTQPERVVVRFSEAVEGNFGAVRVFDAHGARVDDGKVTHPGGRAEQLAVGLKPGLARGSYTATYRVVSADSHPVSGGLIFSVGHAGSTETVAHLLAGSGAGPVTETAFGVARGLGYLATALALGTLAFLLAVWAPALATAAGAGAAWAAGAEAFARRARRLLAIAIALGVLAGLAGLVLQGATAAGTTFWSALDPSVVREVLGTRFGTVWGLRVLAWVALAAILLAGAGAGAGARTVTVLRPVAVGADGFAPTPAPGHGMLAALALPVAFLAVSPALAGHATTQHPVAVLLPLDIVHVVAMSVWIAGLVALLFLVPAATRRLDAPDRSRLLAALLVRFSPVALGCVVALGATGATLALLDMGGLAPLLSTPFGRAVLVKALLLAVLVALGAVNRSRAVPALRRLAAGGEAPGAAGRLLRRTLRAEVALVVCVLGVTAALVSYAPPSSSATTGPFSQTTRMGPIELQATIDPARIGPNQLHVYLFEARSGAPFTRTRQLEVDATLPGKGIGPLAATMRRAGPGHYVAETLTLSPGGEWRLRVTDRVSDFDEYTTTLKVPVR